MTLTAEEARVLGCLMEKAVTTPDGYPLSLNSVVTACNQTTNRDPIVALQRTSSSTARSSSCARRA